MVISDKLDPGFPMTQDPLSHSVHLKRTLAARRWKVLRLITRMEDFTRFMPNVKKCEVISKSKNQAVTSWLVDMEGVPLRWKQREEFDFKAFTIRFEAIEGDLAELKGEWRLFQHGERETDLEVWVRLRLGIPQVEEAVGHLMAGKLRKNFEAMMDSFQDAISLSRYRKVADRETSDIRGFAVMCHPYDYDHLVRYIQFFKKDLRLPSPEFLSKVFDMTPSYDSYKLKEFRSKTGKVTYGHFIMCPFVPEMLNTDLKGVIKKVVDACKVGERLRLGIVGLGGFCSIAGEMNNKSIRQMVHIPVTTGNAYTSALVLMGIRKAASLMGMDLSRAKVTIIGGAGDIGSACARILAMEVPELTITSRSEKNLADIERTLSYLRGAKIKTQRDNRKAVKDADIVISAASSTKPIVEIEDFKPGAIVCDVGYPKNISHSKCDRKDIFVFSGGICSLPSPFDFGFDVGLPSTTTLYGCYAEAIILDLEERYVNFSEGKGHITKEQVDEITALGAKHGFGLAPFFWGDKLLNEQDIQDLRSAREEALLKYGG